MIVKKNSSDITIYVALASSDDGTPKTGLTITAIDATYTRNRSAAVKNDLTALTGVTDAHTDNKGIEVDSTNAPGIYRIDFPDAAFASGADKVVLTITCSGVVPVHMLVELVDYDFAGMNLTHIAGSAVNTASAQLGVNVVNAAGTAWGSGAITAASLATDAANEIADAVLTRNVSNVEASAQHHTLCTLILAGLEWSIADTTWTIKRTDGTTPHYTKTLTTSAGADPIIGVQ